MKIFRLNRTVVSVKNNADKFLNGLTSNSTDRPRNAFLDIHGKVIAVFDQIKIAEDEFLIVIGETFVDDVFKHIDRFIRLSKAEVKRADFKTYFDLEGTYPAEGDEWLIPQKKGNLILTKKNLESNVSVEEFTLFRLRNNLPVQGEDFNHEMLLNVDDQEYVSFSKGCFLGQELISKVHNRSQPTWKLVVQYEDEAKEERQPMTSKTIDPENGRIFGFVFVKNS